MLLRRRSAVSYIMSVAIMTFVTLAMASVVLVWSLGQTATSQNTFASAINANEAKAEERYTIEQVQFLTNGQTGGGYTCGTSTGASGTATGVQSSTTLQDTTKSGGSAWTTNQWKGYFVSITSGTGSGQTRTVASNTANTLTVSSAWTITPDGTSVYSVSFGCLVLYVRNVGSIQLVADAVYVNNQLALQTQYATLAGTVIPAPLGVSSPVRLSLGIQQLGSIAVPVPFPTSAGTTYTLSVSTTRGNVVTVVQTY